ncbi:MAG: hypothetical protein ACLPX5_02575 [Dissulfurispiraceae bacterium]
MPFAVKAIQLDGDSAFYEEFETACKEKGIALFVLPPSTHTQEFYEVTNCSWTIPELNKQLVGWEHFFNCI